MNTTDKITNSIEMQIAKFLFKKGIDPGLCTPDDFTIKNHNEYWYQNQKILTTDENLKITLEYV